MPAVERPLLVLPAFNESGAIAGVLAEIQRELPGVACLVVDDGSIDGTAIVAESAGVPVARLPFNLGVGGAMRLGFRYALANGYDAVVQIDADGQHDPSAVPELLEGLGDADVVIGARFAGSGIYTVHGPRRWAMRLLSAALSRAAKVRLTDTTSGFKASGSNAVALFAEHYPAEYLGDTVEALVLAVRNGLQIKQVPVAMRERVAGTPSHNPVRAALYLGRAVFALLFAFIRPVEDGRKETA